MPDPTVLTRLGPVRGATPLSTTWWGTAVVRALEESAFDTADLRAGRTLARSGRVGAVMVLATMASAVVEPDDVVAQLKVRPLDDWSGFADEVARESGFLAALEAGQLPEALLEHADEAGIELLPGSADLETACACAAWTQPCRHAVALLQQLAWHVDRDPYVLLLLRGRTREWLVEEVTARHDRAVRDHGAVERDDAASRSARILALAAQAPTGHGLADSAVAAYDEAVSRLLDPPTA